MAGRCSIVFVEQPKAISTVKAFSKACLVKISRGQIFLSINSIICIPAFLASLILLAVTAGIVPFPGRPMPIVSVKQFIELAVNIPAQEPQPGQATSTRSSSSASLICPVSTLPTASKTSIKSKPSSPLRPASIGPPLTTIEGMFSLIAAINMPGTILSQLGIRTIPSKRWASTVTSTESAIISRLASEYFMPSWFMAIPSQMPIVKNSRGVPPARRIPALVASAILSRLICPGITSL